MNEFAVELNGLTKRFGDFVAVNNLNMRIRPGEVYGFLGANGSGKSTTIRMITGVLEPTSGSGSVLGSNIVTEVAKVKPQIGYMSQKFSLYNDLTVLENLEFYGGIYGIPRHELKKRSRDTIKMAMLEGRENELTANLSGGWRQRLSLGCAILHDPKVIFLDEPTSGVDPLSRRMFWDIIDELSSRGTTIMVTTHYIDEAEHCNRVGIIFNSNLIAEGTPQQIREGMPGDLYSFATQQPLRLIQDIKESKGWKDTIKDIYANGAAINILVDKGAIVNLPDITLEKIQPTLEDVFVYIVDHGRDESIRIVHKD